MINFIKDTPLINDVFKYDVILFAMGINNSMANGFNYDIALNFPKVLEVEGRYQYGDIRKYGTIHETESEDILFVACYIKNTSLKKNKNDVFINYEYLDKCLKSVCDTYKDKKIGCPILGCNEFDGNGDENIVLNLFNKYFKENGDITLYRYKQNNFSDNIYKTIKQIHYKYKHKLITTEKYLEIRRILEWRKNNGIFSEVPDEYIFLPKKKMKRKITYNKSGVNFLEK